MPLHLDDIFPDHAVWPFFDRCTNATPTLNLTSRIEAGRRVVELNGALDHHFRLFFDRMTITGAGLELNRVRFGSYTLDICPPLTITTGGQVDHVANLLPGMPACIGTSRAPYDGSVVSKKFKEMPNPGTAQADFVWEVRIVSRGAEGSQVFDATMEFSRSGLVSYKGQLYGVFFVYERTDLAPYVPPSPHPGPVPRPAPPPPPPPVPHGPTGQQPYVPYHDRIVKEVWDAQCDAALLARLRKRAKEEPELKELLERRHMLEDPKPGG